MFDFITIGSATIDTFVETDEANIVCVNSIDSKNEFISYPYGSKIEIDEFDLATGGGALNTAVNFANLGFKTSSIIKIGEGLQGQNILERLDIANVDKSNVVVSEKDKTGFSIILTSFQGDRTVLAHRGANATLSCDEINFDAIKNSKWLYIAPLNGESTKVLDKIAAFAEENDVNMAINVGTSSIKRGEEYLKKILKTAEVVIMNKEEASMLTKIKVRPDSKENNYSKELIHPDIKAMLTELKFAAHQVIIITDGKNGVYAFDGNNYYQCPEFPAKVVSSLGAGDCFSSTFVATLEKTNGDIKKALAYASVNAAAVVENFGAQAGFLLFDEIENKLKLHPEFNVNIL